MKRLLLSAALLTLCLLGASATATAQPSAAHFYVDEIFIDHAYESSGVWFHGATRAVDNASCIGLRRFGVRADEYGSEKFWRFRCDLNGANGHTYDAQVSTTTGPKRGDVYWHVIAIRQLY